MKLQNFELKNQKINAAFLDIKDHQPERLKQRLNFSWSNWGFGIESLEETAVRLESAGIHWIELHGNHYGPDLGYKPADVLDTLGRHKLQVAGICGMFSIDNDPSSNRAIHRQAAVDYIRRELEFAKAVGASYLLVCPSAVGRPGAYDLSEFDRSIETYRIVADDFVRAGVKGAVEPIRSAEVSLCHTVADAKKFITTLDHPGIQHINGDVYHMQAEESHIGEAILSAGAMLTNLHLADSNRSALGESSLDVDTIIKALYVIGYNRPGCFITPEPLGPGGDPYPAMYGKPEKPVLDHLVRQTAEYFNQRETELLS
jgi:D-psicose/D-tagatose/L-ribulose 3-epimerase